MTIIRVTFMNGLKDLSFFQGTLLSTARNVESALSGFEISG